MCVEITYFLPLARHVEMSYESHLVDLGLSLTPPQHCCFETPFCFSFLVATDNKHPNSRMVTYSVSSCPQITGNAIAAVCIGFSFLPCKWIRGEWAPLLLSLFYLKRVVWLRLVCVSGGNLLPWSTCCNGSSYLAGSESSSLSPVQHPTNYSRTNSDVPNLLLEHQQTFV